MDSTTVVARLEISPGMEETMLRKIEQLRPAESIELACERDLRALLGRLQESHGAYFDSWQLEIGPPVWRMRITRRDPQVARTIADFLGKDHQRLRDTWAAGRYAAADCNLKEVRKAFSEFVVGLTLHMRMEEEVLFPAIEQRTGMRDSGPTAAMRAEHTRFKEILGRLTRALEEESCEAISRMLQSEPTTPEDLFNSHDLREERVLYPMADRLITSDEKLRLIAAMQRL